MFENMRLAAAATTRPEEMLAAVVGSYFDQLDELRSRSYVLYGDAPRRAVDEMRRRNAELIEQLLRAGSRLSEPDLKLAAQLIVGAGEQVGRWWLEHRDVPIEDVKARYTTAIGWAIRGLGG